MTVETINVPSQPAADRRPDTSPSAAGSAAPSAGSLWWRVWWRSGLVPLTVLAPIVALAPTADHRFNIYWHGALFRDDPLRIVPHTLDSLPSYLGMGNFRPLGRMLEKSLDLFAYTITDLVGVPATISFRLVSFLGAVLLTVAAVLFAESFVNRGRLFRGAPSVLAATVPFAVGGSFIAAGSTSPTVLFGGLYFLSAALVLVVGAAVCRVRPDARIGWWRGAALILAGAVLAVVNEIAYLALPFATVAVLLRHRTKPALRVLGLLWLGFLPVFGAVRAVIFRFCADGGCYRNSDIDLGPGLLQAEPVRLVAWLPPLMWRFATDGKPWLAGLVTLIALLVLSLLGWRTVRDLRWLGAVERGTAVRLAIAAGALVALGATLGSLNGEVQGMVADGHIGQGWRDTAVTAAAGAVMLTALVHAWSSRRWVLTGLLVALVLAATASAAANQWYADKTSPRASAVLANRVAQEMATFDTSPAGDRHRCQLRAEFQALYPDTPFSLNRFDAALDLAARQRAGVPFCAGANR